MRQGITQSKLFRAVVVIVLCLGVAWWDPTPVSSVFRGMFHTVMWPIEKLASSFSFTLRDTKEFLSSIGELKRENETLEKDNLHLRAENASLAFLRGENEALRKSVGLKVREKFDLTAGEVIASGGEAQKGYLLVDQGTLQEVRPGMAAVVGEGVLVGIVDEVYPASSRIVLLTHSRSAVGGVTVESGAKGIVKGDRGLGMLFDMVLGKDSFKSGDRVVTSGAGGVVPAGLLVGTVDTVRDSEDRLFRQSGLLSPVAFENLRFVFLIRDRL